ncbi:glycerol-3-phosphate 1-O-acyltransferase PlsY [Nosocomiicoccus ampullae]|uniref:Glycerol-3-phosphate acyltransferase n=1 Tax=Nosocomiicoccus ampullae TaxID=489910 RepID=A0A9Q2HF07_9STAP|nr:glycerol-3-phosphate 1-O-acyltransferase PlsY [Nosocomiicoccus ampullae]MBB5175346.1 glycerol-3-phosphate acyltransferase PlsY [Nosocomiicoccus ampullae]QYA46284.1 glycerol-3-phosphate 1-O-acyltransferase PlsY [Nosocomiicoccus ampullae]
MEFSTIALLILSYLIGSIPFALIIGKIFFDIDIRNHGSGNIGTTNTFRILGKKAGIIVLILDFLKGMIPVYIAMLANTELPLILFGLCAALGHVYSIFLKFKGGKAVATGAGVILAVQPLIFLILLTAFLITLYISKYVSLGSIVGVTTLFILSLFTDDLTLKLVSLLLLIIIIYKHLPNIKRIMNKTEPKVKLF